MDVKALLGPGHEAVEVVDVATKTSSSEVLTVNGTVIRLDDDAEGREIRDCLLNGRMPRQDLINHLLASAGLVLKSKRQVVTSEIVVNAEKRQEAVLLNGDALAEVASKTSSKTIRERKSQVWNFGENEKVDLAASIVDGDDDAFYAFLLWSRLFVTPAAVLAAFQHHETDSDCRRRLRERLRLWIKWFPEDFADEATAQKLRKRLQALDVDDEKKLFASLNRHLNALRSHRSFFEEEDGAFSSPHILDLNPKRLAQELTRIELDYLSLIGASQVVNVLARSFRSKEEASARLAASTSRYDAYVAWFERLSRLVAASVCAEDRKRRRAAVIDVWIETARVCVELGNFNSLMGVISGLGSPPVARLKKTWAKTRQTPQFSALERQADPTANFVSYRSTLTAAVARSEKATSDVQRIVVPFFSLFVRDVFFAWESAPMTLDALAPLTITVKEFVDRKDVECPFEEKCETSRTFLRRSDLNASEERLDFESFCRESPTNPTEKERFKTLKYVLNAYRASQN